EALRLRLAGQGADDVIGLETIQFKYWYPKTFYDLLYFGNSVSHILRCFLACCLIRFEYLIAKGRGRSIEGYGNVRGLLLLQHFHQGIGKPKGYGSVMAPGVDTGTLRKCEMGTIDQRKRIEQKELF